MTRSQTDQAIADRMYDSFRDDLMKRDLSNTENYDRAIFTVSTSFLGASIAFIKFVVPLDQAEFIWLLHGCWALLFIALSFSIAAYRVGNQAIELKLVQARRYYKEHDESAFTEGNKYERWNNWLNSFAGSGLVIVMLLLIIFVSINITKKEPTMAKDIPLHQSTSLTRSANVPTMDKVPSNSASIPKMEQAPSTAPPSPGESTSSKK